MATLLLGVGFFLLIAVVGGAAFILMRRRDSEQLPEQTDSVSKMAPGENSGPSMSFTCAKCGKKLKIKEALAGKKVKCNHCGEVVPAPRADAFEADQAR